MPSSWTHSARAPAVQPSTRAATANGTCCERSPAKPCGSGARSIRRRRPASRPRAPTPARRWRPNLASLWDRARLEWNDRDGSDDIARVLTPVTSLLVLETEQDYRRFGLEVPQPIAMERGGRGKRHRGEEGKMGKRTSASREGLYGLAGPRDNPDPQLAQRLAEEQAHNAGILGVLKQTEAPKVDSIFDQGAALGSGANDVLSGLIGNQVGESSGVGVLGLTGTGSGGGGTSEGTIGLGNLGTIGKGGGGQGNGSGYGRGAGGLGGRRVRTPDVVLGTAKVRGALDQEIVRRLVRRHINEVRYCYEQELTKAPNLGGRVLVQFTIAASGQVIASRPAEFDDRQHPRRELHRPGDPPLGVSEAARRRHRHRVVSVRDHPER